MKKLLLSLTAIAALTLTSCEDVPMPYNDPNGADQTQTVAPSGTGTHADPYNVAAAQQLISNKTFTAQPVYIKGKVVSVSIDTSYGNATYYINDSKTATGALEVYRGYTYNGAKFKSTDELKVGDEVVVYGTLTSTQVGTGSQIYSINGITKTVTPAAEPKGKGTEADPYNVSAAIKAASALDASGKVENVYVSGIISEMGEVSTSYGNATYYISDDGKTDNQFEIYRGYYLNGDKFTSADQIKVGDKVTVLGTLVNFNGKTLEMTAGSKIVSLNGQGGSQEQVGLNATFKSDDGGFTIDNVSMPSPLTYVWKHDALNGFMKASAYMNKTNVPAESRLVSPAFSLKGLNKATLTFEHTARFFKSAPDELKVMASADGGTTWTPVTVSTWPDGASWTFVTATADLSAFAGKSAVRIAFVYTSSANAAATWEVKKVVVK